ncbi:MAG: WYL domain-containing protein [Bacteroidota bacterium]
MPRNKEALIRYRIINRCLVNKKYVTMPQLIEACEEALDTSAIGKRTIEKDIADMRNDNNLGYYAPIIFDRGEGAYYYEDSNYSIDKIPINSEEIEALAFCSGLLEQIKDTDIFETFSGAVQKLVDAINIRRMQHEEKKPSFIEFEKAPFYEGSKYLKPLIDAINKKKVITITHQKFEADQPSEHTLSPCYLKEYHNRWYIIGWHHARKAFRTFALERITKVHVEKEQKFIDENFDPALYFKHTIGIIAPQEKPVQVVLKLSMRQGRYVLTQPIHESQEVWKDGPEEIVVSLLVVPTYELIAFILGLGPEVTVVQPESLRRKVQQMLRANLDLYSR